MGFFVLLKQNSIELTVSFSQGWFEPSRYSFPLNSIFEKSIWDETISVQGRKEGKGKGQFSPWPDCVPADLFYPYTIFQHLGPYINLWQNSNQESEETAKIRAYQCWWITTKNFIHFCSIWKFAQHFITHYCILR